MNSVTFADVSLIIRGNITMHEALYYNITDKEKKELRCFLCPHHCLLGDGKIGICRVRKNIEGKLYSLIYAQFTSAALDPIEKKPLYHFYPGREILSLGTVGCNLCCQFCQNWEISQKMPGEIPTRQITPEEVIRLAAESDSVGVAYTYNEPFINYEFVFETAELARKHNLKNVLVTNGYVEEQPLEALIPYIDAANVDVKSFRDDFYKKICAGRLSPVLRTVEIMLRRKIHIEITNLIIPTLNDGDEEIGDLVDWLSSLDSNIPLHFSRYLPCYKMQINPTPLATLEKARKIALNRMNFVYLGNVWELESSNTYCPQTDCRQLLIERHGHTTKIIGLEDKHCQKCGTEVNIKL